MSATLLIAELKAIGPVIEPLRDGMRLTAIEIAEKEGRPIAIFSYDSGRKATIGVGDGDCGITAFVMDGVVVAFARMSYFAGRQIGLDMTDRQALAATCVQVVTSIERLRADDVSLCVGPLVDVDALDLAPRYADVIPSITRDDLALARSSTWTPDARYRQAAEAEGARRFAGEKDRTESRRNPAYVPAWGVRAAAADVNPTPSGRARLGRAARR